MNEKNYNFEKLINDMFGAYVNKYQKNQTKDYVGKENNNLKNAMDNYLNNNYSGFSMNNILDDKNNSIGVKLTYLVPGLTRDDLNVSIEDNICYVQSSKNICYFGRLSHKVKMKFEVDIEKSTSKLENGILTVSLYKKKANSTAIKISVE